MIIADTLREARRRIEEPEKWGKGVDVFHGRECAGLAIDRAARELGLSFASDEYNQAEALFQQAIKTHSIVGWNDFSKRTHAEVLRAFDKAIELAEAKPCDHERG